MTDTPLGSGEPGTNPDLATMHRDLVTLVRKLEEIIDTAPTVGAIETITDQMAEVNARVTSTGRMLLARQTIEIAIRAAAVSARIPAIVSEIEDIERLERAMGSVTALLDTVDETVRISMLKCA